MAEGLCVHTEGESRGWDETEMKPEITILFDAEESLCDVLLLATSAST